MNKKTLHRYFVKNNISLYKVLNSIFKDKVKKITYLGICKMKKIPEYKFNLAKFNVVLQDYSNYTIFIRTINVNQLKETLFCYWFFCENYFGINTKFYSPKANIINVKNKYYEKRYNLQLLVKNNKIYKSSLIDIIDMNKYCKANLQKPNSKEFNKYLFIAII